jgi:hypothetical protein
MKMAITIVKLSTPNLILLTIVSFEFDGDAQCLTASQMKKSLFSEDVLRPLPP